MLVEILAAVTLIAAAAGIYAVAYRSGEHPSRWRIVHTSVLVGVFIWGLLTLLGSAWWTYVVIVVLALVLAGTFHLIGTAEGKRREGAPDA